jgi:hypothetical protein
MSAARRFDSLSDFYERLYKIEHCRTGTRVLHVVGTALGATQFVAAALLRRPALAATGVVTGYAFAWFSHFFIEKNRPATFKYPVYSFFSDWIMAFNILTGRESVFEKPARSQARKQRQQD